MTNENESFFQEVDESLRQDQMTVLAKKYGPWVLGAIVLILVGVLAWQGWQSYQQGAAREHSVQFEAAQQMAREGNLAGAKAEFERLAETGPAHYRVMARLEHAAILESEGDLQGALTEFDAAAEQARDPVMKESAQLRAAYIVADTQDFEALQTRLQPLVESESRISFMARELLAIEAWEAGQLDIARSQLENLTLAFDVPQAVQERAQVALAVIGPAPASTTPADGAAAPAPSEGETK